MQDGVFMGSRAKPDWEWGGAGGRVSLCYRMPARSFGSLRRGAVPVQGDEPVTRHVLPLPRFHEGVAHTADLPKLLTIRMWRARLVVMLAIRIHQPGGAEQMRADELATPSPGPGEVRFRAEAIGVNFIDTYRRSGLYPVPLPHTLGSEAAGVVTAVGANVTELKPGDRIASVSVRGAYAQEAIAVAAQTVKVPDGVTTELAAAALLQGMTAHYLACDTWPLKPGDAALVQAGAGGVGLLLIQIAKKRGARVLATVGNDEKAKLAREAGADAVCVYTRENFVAAARAFTEGRGVDVVYDGVGRTTFEGSLDSLRPRGLLASFGNASGAVPEFKPLLLSQKGSLFLTRPTVGHYTATSAELRARAGELFGWIARGELRVRIGARFPLVQAAEAHRVLEGRATTGKVLLMP